VNNLLTTPNVSLSINPTKAINVTLNASSSSNLVDGSELIRQTVFPNLQQQEDEIYV